MTLRTLSPKQWHSWITQAVSVGKSGKLPQYIPRLAEANPEIFNLRVEDNKGLVFEWGDQAGTVTMMSVMKPFLWLYILHHHGYKQASQWVGDRPSNRAYNSLSQLQEDQCYPCNAMVNSGAISLAEWLPGGTALEKCDAFAQWLNGLSGARLFLDQNMLDSVRSLPNPRNQAIIAILNQAGYSEKPALALDTYNHLCCLAGTLKDYLRLGRLLPAPSLPITSETCSIVWQTLIIAGLYQYSEAFFKQTGFACKSAVSGLVMAWIPATPWALVVAYSPSLDAQGNPAVPLFLLQQLATTLRQD